MPAKNVHSLADSEHPEAKYIQTSRESMYENNRHSTENLAATSVIKNFPQDSQINFDFFISPDN
jgi:hypothetical protein